MQLDQSKSIYLEGKANKTRRSYLAGVVQASGVTGAQHVGGDWPLGQHVWDAALSGPQADVTSLYSLRVLCSNCAESVKIKVSYPQETDRVKGFVERFTLPSAGQSREREREVCLHSESFP